jgi:hypothetical protein
MRRIPLPLVLACLTVAIGCGGGSASTTLTGQPSTASARHQAACAVGGRSLVGDLDGDRKPDRVTIASRPAPARGCYYTLVADTARGTHRYGLGTRNYRVPPPEAPALDALASIDRRAGLEIVADVWRGASTQFAAVFTLHSGKLVPMSGQTVPPLTPEGRAFPYSGSVTHQNGIDCFRGAGSGLVVASGAAGFSGKHWDVTRRVYRVVGTGFLGPFRTQRVQIPYRNNLSTRFPEFSRRPFSSCIEATP